MRRGAHAVCIVGLAFVASPAHGSESLLACIDRGFVLQQCALSPAALAEGVVENGTPFETEYAIDYTFSCAGHRFIIGVATESGFAPFEQGTPRGALMVRGFGSLRTSDPDPERTRRLSAQPGCHLTVHGVTRAPSRLTIAAWGAEARERARSLSRAAILHAIAADYTALASWHREKLELLAGRLGTLREQDPTNVHYRVMLRHVDAALAHAPSPVAAPELSEAGAAVTEQLRVELFEERALALALQARFARWRLELDGSLQEILDALSHH
jgi:hypothetical protein